MSILRLNEKDTLFNENIYDNKSKWNLNKSLCRKPKQIIHIVKISNKLRFTLKTEKEQSTISFPLYNLFKHKVRNATSSCRISLVLS